jgi:hypothetical protein
MNQSLELKKKSKNKSIIAFVAIGIATMLIAGYFVGGSLNSLATSSTTKSTQQQGNILENNTTHEELQNITYYYNSTSLAQVYNEVKDSVVVITGYVLQYSFFGRQYSEVQGSGFDY